MKLTVQERINLMDILPKQGNFVELKIARNQREELDFSEEELQRGEITIVPLPDGRVNWVSKAPNKVVKDCKITELAENIILTELKNLDKQKKLRAAHLTLYEKFVLAKEEPPEEGEGA